MLDYNNIYNTYSPKLKVLFNKQVKDKDYVDDLVQDTLIKVWENIDKYDETYQLSTWIYTIAFNTLKNYYKSEKNHITYVPEVLDNDRTECFDNPQDILIAGETEKSFSDAINKLNESFLSVYVMKEVDGMSQKDIAAQLNIPLGTVKSRLKRARDYVKSQVN